MEIRMIRQCETRSIFLALEDGKAIVKLSKPFFVTLEEAGSLIDAYADQHPELFPARERARENFNQTFGGRNVRRF